MRTLRLGMQGLDVEAWQAFLRGQGFDGIQIDGDFGQHTAAATKAWQRDNDLTVDGAVGPVTSGKAQQIGFDPGWIDDDPSQDGPNWPPEPEFEPLTAGQREALFGEFRYEAAPRPGNPEAIHILDDWPARNIVKVTIPQLKGVDHAPPGGVIALHRLAAEPFVRFFQALDDAGLADRLLSFGGGWAPRFVRGRRILSNHAFGSAIDINARWNWLGTVPAFKGRKGSVRELVPLANAHGLYWGGHFSRPDGMHFELAKPPLL